MASDSNLKVNVVVYVYVHLTLMFFVILGKSSSLLRQKNIDIIKRREKKRNSEILCTMQCTQDWGVAHRDK